MKKFLILACVAVLVLGFAATTYAIDWGASGFVRVRSAWGVNSKGYPTQTVTEDTVTEANPALDKTYGYMDTRFRLKFEAKANDYATGVIYFEGDSEFWGEEPGGRNMAGAWNADRPAVELKQFYIDFKVPGLEEYPTTVRAGVQGLSYRANLLLFADGAGVRVDSKIGPAKLELDWFKPSEGDIEASDDTDVYAIRVVLAEGLPIRPAAYLMYWNFNQYPMRSGSDEADFYWFGLYADGKLGPVALKTDFIFSSGDVERDAPTAANPDEDYSGWCFYADASVPIGPATVGATFMYATGNDASETGDDQDRDGYVVPPGSEARWIFTESIVFYPSAVNDSVHINTGGFKGDAVAAGPVGGTWMAKGYASFKPLDWLKVTGYAMYIGDTVDDGDVLTGSTTEDKPGDDDDIGIEIGALADISIYKNLTYRVGAGWLLAGDALESTDLLGQREDPDDPWAVVSQLIFTF